MYSQAPTSRRSDCTADIRRPQDHEAEKWAIGSMLVDPDTAPAIFAIAKPIDFDDDLGHAAAHAIHNAWTSGEPIDVRLIAKKLRNTAGGLGELAAEYLAEIAAEFPTAAHAEHYARRVAWAARMRKWQELSLWMLDEIQSSSCDQADKILERVLSDVPKIATAKASDPWEKWETSLHEQSRQTFYDIAGPNNQLNRFRIAPGRMTILGGLPGSGKTLLAMQSAVNVLLAYPEVRVLVANCEMDPSDLLDRNLSRLAQVPYQAIRDRTYAGERRATVLEAARDLAAIKPRLKFMPPPFTMAQVRALSASHKADIVVIDYLQRFKASESGSDLRAQVTDCMSAARELAMSGPAVLMLSALSRQGDYRESSEVEYACDYAYKIVANPNDKARAVCECHKARNDARENIEITFNHAYQEVTAASEAEEWPDFEDYAEVPQFA